MMRGAFLHSERTGIAPMTQMRNGTMPNVSHVFEKGKKQRPYVNHEILVTIYLFVFPVYLFNSCQDRIRRVSEILLRDT